MGDDVQAIKAGILEIADIFVVNKADRAGVERAVATLKAMLELGHASARQSWHHGQRMHIPGAGPALEPRPDTSWEIPVLKTAAIKGEGIEQVMAKIDQHFEYLKASGELAQRNRTRLLEELQMVLQTELLKQLLERLPAGTLADITAQLVSRDLTPYAAARQLIASLVDSR
jgi:LAO/AO transport system kinase